MIRHKGFVVAAVISAALMSGAWFLQRETEPAGSVYQQARSVPTTCWRTWPTTTSIRSTSASSTRWRSTACSTSCTIRTRFF